MGIGTIINAPLAVNVATIANLRDAIAVARPGTVITLTTAGAPTKINLAGLVKSGVGVHVRMPAGQVYSLSGGAGASNIHFVGGALAFDTTHGSLILASYGLGLTAGASKISVRGALFGPSRNAVAITDCEDIEISRCLFANYRTDCVIATRVTRLKIEDDFFGGGSIYPKFRYYSDGTAPVEGEGSGTIPNSVWVDGDHSDNVQLSRCFDFTVKRSDGVEDDAQGATNFGYSPSNDLPWNNWNYRGQIWDNVFPGKASHGISMAGNDIDVRNNLMTTAAGSIVARLTLRTIKTDAAAYPGIGVSVPIPDGQTAQDVLNANLLPGDDVPRFYGGLNVAPAVTVDTETGLDPMGALNGSADVEPPAPVRIHYPAWVPAPVRPSPAEQTEAPAWISDGIIYPPEPLEVGMWISCRRGKALYVQAIFDPVSYTYQWYRDGSPISGATNQMYQLQAGDSGASITCQYIPTNVHGTGAMGVTAPRVCA